ncbi:MAG: gamma-glutamyl-gamma-aminobutyrate hydrolase family protein [Myxococcales bacterium]|nr:gamma-glutamyl-gamma-aminobutyrate hydrolase family protein [Myxococcales bacterium]
MSTDVVVTGPDHGGLAAWRATRRALARVGAHARRSTPSRPIDDPLEALVVGGGAHVHPVLFGEPAEHPIRAYDTGRDAHELTLLRRARRARVLGICRGMQLATVARGGSLYQDVWRVLGRRPPRRTIFAARRVRVAPDSRLAELLGVTELRVNSLHSQALREWPSDVRPVAWDEDGVVQAVESERFLGVQWHPEYLARDPKHRALFRWVAQG